MNFSPDNSPLRGMHAKFRALKTAANTIFTNEYKDPEAYDKYVRERRGRGILAEQVVHRFDALLGDRGEVNLPILDVAAGTGIISHALENAVYKVTAADINLRMLETLHSQYPAIKTVVADFNEELPFSDGSFMGVTSVWGNRYMNNTPGFVDEVYRLLDKDGVFVWPIFPAEIPLWKMRAGIDQPTSPRSLAGILVGAGFKKLTLDYYDMRYNITSTSLGLTSTPINLVAQK